MRRSAIIQARARPEIKFAAERVLRGLGLTMTEFTELVLRQLIVCQKIPFEVVAMDDRILLAIENDWRRHQAITRTKPRGWRTRR